MRVSTLLLAACFAVLLVAAVTATSVLEEGEQLIRHPVRHHARPITHRSRPAPLTRSDPTPAREGPCPGLALSSCACFQRLHDQAKLVMQIEDIVTRNWWITLMCQIPPLTRVHARIAAIISAALSFFDSLLCFLAPACRPGHLAQFPGADGSGPERNPARYRRLAGGGRLGIESRRIRHQGQSHARIAFATANSALLSLDWIMRA